MRVNIRVFARLRDIVGAAELDRDVPTGTTAQRLWEDLVEEFPDISTYTGSISTAVNAEYAKMETVLDDGDEVAFLPPVSGGEVPGSHWVRLCLKN
ncbi:MAG TPA: molybdopterin converting factor subunit 1 [Acidobacteria bacterium]|jgi:molybdopterin converting factor subunit 1|nr:molybdopterin converting factor subunit 1 [Acidobacteriota bacterium]HIN69778.1 molybdopterin converting factor subunit 1 [Acidobacteriota bacterium]